MGTAERVQAGIVEDAAGSFYSLSRDGDSGTCRSSGVSRATRSVSIRCRETDAEPAEEVAARQVEQVTLGRRPDRREETFHLVGGEADAVVNHPERVDSPTPNGVIRMPAVTKPDSS